MGIETYNYTDEDQMLRLCSRDLRFAIDTVQGYISSDCKWRVKTKSGEIIYAKKMENGIVDYWRLVKAELERRLP
jgi:hypothetical protein